MESGGLDGGTSGSGYEGSDSGGSGSQRIVYRRFRGLDSASNSPLQPDPQQQTQQLLQEVLQELRGVREEVRGVRERVDRLEATALTWQPPPPVDLLLRHVQALPGRVQHGWGQLVGMLLPPSPPSPAPLPLQPPPPPPESEQELENPQHLN
jgi:hypothetical protein